MKKAVMLWIGGIYVVGLLSWWGYEAWQSPERNVMIMADPVVAHDLKQMSQEASLIVVAISEGEAGQRSTASSTEVKTFSFAVHETLKGKAPANMQVRVPYRRVETLSMDGERAKVALKKPMVVAPAVGKKVVLFLDRRSADGAYHVAFQPYLIEQDEQGKAKLIISKESQATVELEDGTRVTLKEDAQIKDTITGRPFADVVREIKNMAVKRSGS
ncbi:hypothetical protein [Laceyella putida]|uniref:SAF domain-containing protein n=1 Tax=Laceyella putida TaxID=110101 RepID=A0ABW2RGX1_9BACL